MREEVLKMIEQLDEESMDKILTLAVALLSAQKESQKENPKNAPCFSELIREVGDRDTEVVGNFKQFGSLRDVASFPARNSTARNPDFLCYGIRRFFYFIAKCYIFIPKHRIQPPRFVHIAIFEIYEIVVLTYEIIEIIEIIIRL